MQILIFSHGELIGDGMIKMPAILRLKDFFPNSHITWMCGRHPSIFKTALKPLVENSIDTVIDQTNFGDNWCDFIKTPSYLSGKNYDLIIDTERRVKSALALRRLCNKKTIFISGSCGWYFSHKKPKKGYVPPIRLIDKIFDLFAIASANTVLQDKIYDIEIPPYFLNLADQLLNSPQKKVLFAPGAGGRFKCWPLDNYIELAKLLEKNAIQPYFILGPQEPEWQSVIQQKLPNARFPLQETAEKSVYLTIALAKKADLSVAADGGVGHILASSNNKMISLWGPTDHLKSSPNGMGVVVINEKSMDAISTIKVFTEIKKFL